ncbi:MAG: hypothetical protein GY799_10690 [Desulfobulbaceae bacterium]|nr:hypothetical protein [Desulfobulbaceae bacterium]
MTLSVVSNAALTNSHLSHQKTGTDTEQTEKSRSNLSPEKNLSGNKFDDNITLSQSEKTNDSSKVIDEKAAENLLSQTMKSILSHSKTAMSAQANTTPQAAQELLTED